VTGPESAWPPGATGDEGAAVPPSRYRRPAEPPSPLALRNLDDWDQLVETSLDRVTETAQRWQAGLAGFIGIITAVLLLGAGRTDTVARGWAFYAVISVLLVAVVLAIVGLWNALAASAPSMAVMSYQDVIAAHGTVRAYKVAAAGKALERLACAKRLMAVALALLVVGIALWWFAPGVPA